MKFSKLVHVLSGNVLVVGNIHDCKSGLEALVSYGERKDKFEIVGFEDAQLSAMYNLLRQFRDFDKRKEIMSAIKERFAAIKALAAPPIVCVDDRSGSISNKAFTDFQKSVEKVMSGAAGIGKSYGAKDMNKFEKKCICDISDLCTQGCKCGGK